MPFSHEENHKEAVKKNKMLTEKTHARKRDACVFFLHFQQFEKRLKYFDKS